MSPPASHNDPKPNLPLLRTSTILRKSPRKQKIKLNELVLFRDADKIVDIDSISKQNSPENFTFKRLYNVKYNEETGILAIHECVSVDRNLHVHLSYHGLVIPLP